MAVERKILHHHQLPLRVAAGNRNHRRAERLAAVVRAESAGEQAVAVGVLNDVARVQAARRKTAHHHVRPNINVFLGVGDDNRFARRASRSVQTHDVFHRTGEQTERIRVAQIRFHRERQLRHVVERAHVGRLQTGIVHAFAEQRNVIVGALDHRFEPLQLDGVQLFQRQKIRRADRMETWRWDFFS